MGKPSADRPQTPSGAPPTRLLVGGVIQPHADQPPVYLHRETPIYGAAGDRVGTVAAVIVPAAGREVTHLLMDCVPPASAYRLLPVSLIAAVDERGVHLQIDGAAISTLALHVPDG